ncbi:MAG: helix-turn-helix domain-containing protein [Sphingomonadales bacterium]
MNIDPRRKAFVRLIGQIQHELRAAFASQKRAKGISKTDVARNIGRHKSFVTRHLNGTANMTLETLSDLAFALEHDVIVRLDSRSRARPVATNIRYDDEHFVFSSGEMPRNTAFSPTTTSKLSISAVRPVG